MQLSLYIRTDCTCNYCLLSRRYYFADVQTLLNIKQNSCYKNTAFPMTLHITSCIYLNSPIKNPNTHCISHFK